MKRIMYLMIALLLFVGIFAGCSTEASGNESDNVVTLRLATQHPIDHMAQRSAEAIKAEVEKNSEGRIEISIYPASQLGDYVQVYEEIMRGTIDLAHITVPETYDPKITASFLPYLTKDYEEAKRVYANDSYLSNELTKAHKDLGVKFLGCYFEGMIGIGSVNELNEPTAMGVDKGVLIRVPGADVFKLPAEELGFRTSTIPYSDVFAAMQTGVVDGWSGGPPSLNYLTFRDVIKHYYQYNINAESTQYIMNLKTFDSLSEEDQKIISDAFTRQAVESINSAQAEDEKYLQMLRDEGINVVEFTQEELDSIANDVRNNVWPKYYKNFTEEFIKGIEESLK